MRKPQIVAALAIAVATFVFAAPPAFAAVEGRSSSWPAGLN
jgi:hypothetical protein